MLPTRYGILYPWVPGLSTEESYLACMNPIINPNINDDYPLLYNNWMWLSVTLNGSLPFKGVFIQARREGSTTPLGQYLDVSSETGYGETHWTKNLLDSLRFVSPVHCWPLYLKHVRPFSWILIVFSGSRPITIRVRMEKVLCVCMHISVSLKHIGRFSAHALLLQLHANHSHLQPPPHTSLHSRYSSIMRLRFFVFWRNTDERRH